LSGDGTLDTTVPAGEEPGDEFNYDPANPVPSHGGNDLMGVPDRPYDLAKIDNGGAVLIYTSAPLGDEDDVTDAVKLVLWAAISAADTDVTAKLVDVHPDGKAMNLCDGIIRARFRAGRDQPQAVSPDEVNSYGIDLWVTSNLFQRGHKIRLEISSSNFPRFDRNPNSGRPFGTDTELIQARQIVHHNGTQASRLVLPVIPRGGPR